MRFRHILPLIGLLLLVCDVLYAQSFRRGGTEFNARRTVILPADKISSVAVAVFLHHGQITPDGKNVAVVQGRVPRLLPVRILQLGPGDFCRLAFQTVKGQPKYEIFYGGSPPEKGAVPEWTNKDGLLLETRQYKDCNTHNFESVRNAFKASKPIGADYVPFVTHSANPFDLLPNPFMSRYSGLLRISTPGVYGFMTSSRDCSFVLIDDNMVVSAPGIHGPSYRAKTGSRKDIKLSAGAHKFEYYHVATGPRTMAVVAWEINPTKPKPEKVVAIPPEAFHANMVVHAMPGPVIMRTAKLVPDFTYKITGDVPLPDNLASLVGVAFKNSSPPGLLLKAKTDWDFGDGQTSTAPNPAHVYLRPGIYTVKLSLTRGARTVVMVNRIHIDRPTLTRKDKKNFHTLDDYLPLLESYKPQTLDASSLRQLVLSYQWKHDLLLSPKSADDEEKNQNEPIPETPDQIALRQAEAKSFIQKAVDAGKVAFVGKSKATGNEPLYNLAVLISPMVRNTLGDSELAFQIWQNGAAKISDPQLKVECEINAADIALNDLLKPTVAKSLLKSVESYLGQSKTGKTASRFQRVLGDLYAATGKGTDAIKAYKRAEQILENFRPNNENTAWRGAYSRSSEKFIKSGKLGRAAAEIHHWEEDFPTEKIDGYLLLTYARYWSKRAKYDQAIARAEQLQTINPASPYTDKMLFLAAFCEVKRGKKDRALATLHSIIKDYPGSPLIASVKRAIKKIESGAFDTKQKR